MNNYLNEAFKQLEMLNEEEFNLNDKDAVKDMKDFMGIDVDDSVEVIDPNAETEDDLEDSYVGKVILDCVVCHSKQYKDPNEVVIDDGELANVGEECPFCYTSDGFKVVGQVAPFDESDEDDDDQDEDDDYDEDEDDDSEFESWRNRIQECLKRLNEAEMSDEDEADTAILANIYTKTQQRANAALTPDEKAVLAKYGLSRDSGTKNIVDKDWNKLVQRRRGQDSDKVNLADRARKMGPRAKNNKDLYLAYRSSDTTDSHDARGRYRQTYQRQRNIANSANMEEPVQQMKNALYSRNFANKELNSIDANAEDRRQKEINRHNDAMAAIDNDAKWRRKTYSDRKETNQKTIDKLLKRKTDESLERVEVETEDQVLSMSQDDNGKVTVSSTPVETTVVPVSDETQQDIELHTDEVNAEDAELNSENYALDQDDFMESLKAKISSMNEAEMSDEDKRDNQILRRIYNKTQRRANAALTSEEQAVLDKYGLYRSTANKDIMKSGKGAFHTSSITSPPQYFRGGIDVDDDRVNLADRARKISDRQPIRDFVNADYYNFSDTTYDHDPKGNYKNTFQRKMNKAISHQMQQPMQDMKRLISTRNYEQDRLDKADANYKDAIAKAKSDYERRMKSAEDSLASTKKYASKSVDYANAEIDRMLKRGKKEDMDESLEQVTVTNDAGSLVVTNDADTNSITVNSKSTIVPVSDEVENKIIADSIPDPDVAATDDVEDFDIDDFDEQSFDELGEGYLKRVYENVDKYKTTAVKTSGKKLTVEGIITFKSGNTKNTQFIFEAKSNKNNSLKFVGENAQISRGKKSFAISGSLNNKQLVVESFNYNYRGKDPQTGKSVRLYGTLKRG